MNSRAQSTHSLRLACLARLGGLAAMLACAASGCSSPDADDSGDVQLGMSASALSQADIVRVGVTITGTNIKGSITQDLSLSGSVWQGVVAHIPVGTDTLFHADAYDRFGVIQYTGEAQNVIITKNNTTVVTIVLQQVNKPAPFDNVAPIIDAIAASTTTVAPRNQMVPNPADPRVTLAVNAHDPNVGDTLSYAWSSSCAESIFATPNSATTVWIPPTVEGTCTITIRVSDQKNASATATFAIVVSSTAGRGSAIINATLNTWPVIGGLIAEPSILAPGQTAQVTLTVTDADNDKLAFAWTTDCIGKFSDPTAQSPMFTLSALSQSGTCTLSVAINDGRGGTNVATFGIHTGTVTTPNLAPEIDSAYQSTTSFTESSAVGFRVVASDPEAQGVTFSWATSPSGFGTFGAPVNTATDSSVTWTAPASFAQGATVQVICTITDAAGESTTQIFDLSGTVTNQCTPGQGQPDQVNTVGLASFALGNRDQVSQGFVPGFSGQLTGIEVGLGRCDMMPVAPSGQLQLLLMDAGSGNTIAKGGLDAASVPRNCAQNNLDPNMVNANQVFTFGQCIALTQGQNLKFLIQWNGVPFNFCGMSGTCSLTGNACTGSADCTQQYGFRVGMYDSDSYPNGVASYNGQSFPGNDVAFRTIMH